ncbi:Zeta toxin domain containing protein [Naviculisporaceae sp. PSN 640]
MARIPDEWKLSASQQIKIFNNEIAPREILPHVRHQNNETTSSTKTSKRQLAVIIVGQTGAGKTRLAPDLLQAMTNILNKTTQQATTPISPAHLIADTYKTYHPFYTHALSTAPHLASPLASTDARIWLSLSCRLAASYRIPVLLESACRHPDDFCQLASIFHLEGYIVLVAVLAVPYPLSRLGILVRYYRNLPEGKVGGLPLRLTPVKVHDDSYLGLEEAARFVDGNVKDGDKDGKAVNGVVVVRRNGRVAYRNRRLRKIRKVGEGEEGNGANGDQKEELDNNEWEHEPRALTALMLERERELSAEELETARRDIEELRLIGNPNVDEQIEEIEGLIAKLLKNEKRTSGPCAEASQGSEQEPEMFDASRFLKEFLPDLD